MSKPCPGCGRAIQKNGGCPSMVCSQCGVNFCWNCLECFRDRGGYCKCHPPPPPPRPSPPPQGLPPLDVGEREPVDEEEV